jgi:hypothetical protein
VDSESDRNGEPPPGTSSHRIGEVSSQKMKPCTSSTQQDQKRRNQVAEQPWPEQFAEGDAPDYNSFGQKCWSLRQSDLSILERPNAEGAFKKVEAPDVK